MSIQALREQKNALTNEARKLLADKGDRVWTKEDQQKYDGIADQIELVNSQIEASQKILDDAADQSFNDVDDYRVKGKKKEQPQAVQALDVFLRKQAKNYSGDDVDLIRNTMSTTTGSEGGYTVQPIIATQLIDAIKAYGFMRQEATTVPTSAGQDMSWPSSDGTAEIGEWVSQNTPSSTLDPTFGLRALNVFKAGSKVVAVPIELLQDSQIDVASFVMNRLGQRIGRISNQGYSVGSGSGQPTGLVTAASNGKIGATGQTVTVTYDDLVDLIDSIDVGYLQGGDPCFMFGQTMRRTLRKLKDTTGRPLWTPGYEGGITGGIPDTLMGYRVCLNNDMPVPAANAKSIAFGNMSQYYIRDALDITLFKFDDSAYVSKGQIGFLAWARTGGNLMDTAAVKLYQHSAT